MVGIRGVTSKLTQEQIARAIVRYARPGVTIRQLAREEQVSPSTMARALAGRIKKPRPPLTTGQQPSPRRDLAGFYEEV